ncbi:MAG: hypothetical protein WCG19_06040 [Chlorobiaceae bacterium]
MNCGTLDIEAGVGAMTYETQTVHPPPIHRSDEGSERLVGQGGFPIGMVIFFPACPDSRSVFSSAL